MNLSDPQFAGLLDTLEAAVAPEMYLADQVAQQACIDGVDAQAAPLDDAANQVQNWNPGTYYFSPDDLDQITKHMITVGSNAYDLLTQAAQSINKTSFPDAQAAFDRALKRISAVSSANIDYVNAVNAARAGGFTAVYAPDLKNWAVETIQATAEALRYTYLVQCQNPVIVTGLIALSSDCIAFANMIKSLVGLVGTAANAAYNAAKHVFSALQWFVAYWPWLAAGGLALGAGIFVWRRRSTFRAILPHHTQE